MSHPIYWPVYGVDPVIVETGGSKVTGENLILGAWGTTTPAGRPEFQTRLIPTFFEAAEVSPETAKGFRPATSSRHSARVAMQSSIEGQGLALVLNPPPELRQQMAAAGAKLITPSDLTNPLSYTYKNSILSDYFWRFAAYSNFGAVTGTAALAVYYSHFLPLLEVEGGVQPDYFPYLKTSGADGSTPEFFDNTTADGVREMIDTVTKGGDFFIAALFPDGSPNFSDSRGATVDIVYPHSLARG